MRFFYALCILVLPSAPLQAEIYSWITPDGSIFYTDKKPETGEYKTIKEKQAPVASSTNHGAMSSKNTMTTKAAKNTPSETQTSDQKKNESFKKCAAIMMELETLSRTEAVYKDDNGRYHTHKSEFSKLYDGKRGYLNDSSRKAAQLELTQEQQRHCDNSQSGLKGTSAALAKLETQLDCEHANHRLEILSAPRLRTADSELNKIRRYIEQTCY